MTEEQSQNLLLKVDPLSTIGNNEFITQGEKFSGNRDSEGERFASHMSSPPLKRQYKRYGFSYFFVIHAGGLHVFNKNLKVYLNM